MDDEAYLLFYKNLPNSGLPKAEILHILNTALISEERRYERTMIFINSIPNIPNLHLADEKEYIKSKSHVIAELRRMINE